MTMTAFLIGFGFGFLCGIMAVVVAVVVIYWQARRSILTTLSRLPTVASIEKATWPRYSENIIVLRPEMMSPTNQKHMQ